jgi:hypothetical protein
LGKGTWKHLSCHSRLALSNGKGEVEEGIPYTVYYGGKVSALQVNWTQEPHLVPKHNLRRVMISSIEFESQSARYLNLAAPRSAPKNPRRQGEEHRLRPGLYPTTDMVRQSPPSFPGLVVVIVVVIACPQTSRFTLPFDEYRRGLPCNILFHVSSISASCRRLTLPSFHLVGRLTVKQSMPKLLYSNVYKAKWA